MRIYDIDVTWLAIMCVLLFKHVNHMHLVQRWVGFWYTATLLGVNMLVGGHSLPAKKSIKSLLPGFLALLLSDVVLSRTQALTADSVMMAL